MKIVVEIDCRNHTVADYLKHRDAWHPTGDPTMVSIDKAYLRTDPTDDSFVLLKFVDIYDDEKGSD